MIDQFYIGDTLEFPVNPVADYSIDEWTLKYRFTPRFATPVQAPFTLTATVTDGQYWIQAAPTTTATWQPGKYGWARWLEKTGARVTLDSLWSQGQSEFLPDPTLTSQGDDNRSVAQTAVDDLRSALATFNATNGTVKSYTIGDRSMTFNTEVEILQRLSYWENQVALEEKAARATAGLKSPRGIYFRFDRP